jgi:hypothetical protein
MCARRVIVRSIILQDAPKMGFVPDDHVVEALAPDRTDDALDITVLPRRSRGRGAVANAHRSHSSLEHLPIGTVVISDEILRRRVPREGFGDLQRQPFRSRVRGDADP